MNQSLTVVFPAALVVGAMIVATQTAFAQQTAYLGPVGSQAVVFDKDVETTQPFASTPGHLDEANRSLHDAFLAARHNVEVGAGGYIARSLRNDALIRFDKRGFLLRPYSFGWSFGLQLERFGWKGSLEELHSPQSTCTNGNEVAYEWGQSLSEWWVNGSNGLEHGFTVFERPSVLNPEPANHCVMGMEEQGVPSAEHTDETLVFEFTLLGGLQAMATADRLGIQLIDQSGGQILSYSGLLAFDANGMQLDSRMEVEHKLLRITVLANGAQYPITVDPVVQTTYLKPSNTRDRFEFGKSIAISGDTAVIGAPGEDSAATGVNGSQAPGAFNAGAAYVFVRSGSAWIQQAYLKASNTNGAGLFGKAVAISGNTIAVGAVLEGSSATGVNGNQLDTSEVHSGAVYVFERVGTAWGQQAYIKASNTSAFDEFGDQLALDGDILAVSSLFEDSSATGINGNDADNSMESSGAVYVFSRSGSTWAQESYIKASNTNALDFFGHALALSGGTLVVGARFEDSSGTGASPNPMDNSAMNAGAAYVFVRSGNSWSQQAFLKPSNTGTGDEFGRSADIAGDTIVIGAAYEDSNGNQADNSIARSGAAYVFVRSGTLWSQQAYLKASNPGATDAFGVSVAIDGNTAVVGAAREGSQATGVDGDQANNGSVGAGAAYLFYRAGSSWNQQAYIKSSNPNAFDYFGATLDLEGNHLIVGAPFEDGSAVGVNGNQASNSADFAGAAYVFDLATSGRLGVPYCTPAIPNSTGNSSVLEVSGNAVAFANDVTLFAHGMPMGVFGYFLNGTAQIPGVQPSGSQGLLCLGGSMGRYNAISQIQNSGALGEISLSLDLTQTPQPLGPEVVLAGQTWNFQGWHRDTIAGVPSSNFTNAVSIQFQ